MPRKIRQVSAMNEQHLHYSMVIEWSEEDQAYLVILPEWADRVIMPVTHGDTYSEAVQHGQEVLEMLVRSAMESHEVLPSPKIYAA
jgi:antitoxin HicB